MDRDIKAKVLKRDNFRCVNCGSVKHLDIHHIFPAKYGGENRIENLITLCRSCHQMWEDSIAEYINRLLREHINFGELATIIVRRCIVQDILNNPNLYCGSELAKLILRRLSEAQGNLGDNAKLVSSLRER